MNQQSSNRRGIGIILSRLLLWVRSNKLTALLLLIGIIIRTVYITAAPPGLNQDEASIGYDAYSILHYGIDRNGSFLPVHLIAWGSGQNALYAYLSMPFIYLFGLSPLSIRLVSVIAGCLSLLLFYLTARRTFPAHKQAHTIAMFLIVICPWHIMLSRWSLESNLFPTVVLLAVYLALRAVDQPRWLLGFTAVMAVSLYAYGTAYFFVPLFLAAVYTLLWIKKLVSTRMLWLNALMVAVLAMPIFLFFVINRLQYGAIQALVTIPRLTHNRFEEMSSVFQDQIGSTSIHNFLSFLDILITQSDGLLWNAMPQFGYMYPIALPFIASGLIVSIRMLARAFSTAQMIMIIWFGLAVLMSFITEVNINRMNIVFYPIIWLMTVGLAWVLQKDKWTGRSAAAAFSILFVLFLAAYFKTFPQQISPVFYESFGEAIAYASDATDGTVYITDSVNMPYIYVLFYEQMNPHDYLDSVKYRNEGAAFQWVDSFGRYRFGQPEIHPGEAAAYLYADGEDVPVDESRYAIKKFKHYSVVMER